MKTVTMKLGSDTVSVSEAREAHYKKLGYERVSEGKARKSKRTNTVSGYGGVSSQSTSEQ